VEGVGDADPVEHVGGGAGGGMGEGDLLEHAGDGVGEVDPMEGEACGSGGRRPERWI
jgi:hypothetical protein